jgi:hypothetical protein
MKAPEHPSEIDKAIDLLIALKSARPQSFDDAMAKIQRSDACAPKDNAAHASNLALGLLKGAFGPDSSRMLLELADSLPRLASGALGLASKPGAPPASLAAKTLRMHGLGSAWTRFIMRAIRDGLMPVDPDCSFELACRLEESVDDPADGHGWLGHPEAFHEALGSFFGWNIDWRSLEANARFDFLPWIFEHWLHEASPASVAIALDSCLALLEAGAANGLTPSSWLEFARPATPEHSDKSLQAMRACLALTLPIILDSGQRPCLMLCKLAYPTPAMPKALREAAALDPGGHAHIDSEGRSCLYWVNERVAQHDSSQWQGPLLDCFSELLRLGADARLIAPQISLSSMANHPQIAAAVECAEISDRAASGSAHASKSL